MARKQGQIPGTERKNDKQISAAAEDLHEVRTQRMDLTKSETEAADRLIDLMLQKGVEEYIDDDLEIRVLLKPGKTKVSVQRIMDEQAVE